MSWTTTTLGAVTDLKRGFDLPRSERNKGIFPIFSSSGMTGTHSTPAAEGPCVITGRYGTIGEVFYSDKPCWPLNTALYSTEFYGNNPKFVYYLLKTIPWQNYTTASAVPGINRNHVNNHPVVVPDRKTQDQIVCILESIDNKLSLNRQINDYLVDLATALFEKALDEETCLIPFGELAELEDSKRIPLNKQDREKRKGPYPYYGATSIMDYVDDYLFDDIRVLLGEDGSVMTDEGYPFLQYVWGKYWVNNHAHIIKAKSDYSLEALYLALRRTVINHIVTGAVQMKISQKNLNGLELQMPNLTTIPDFGPFFAMYRHNTDEAKRLAKLRDILLPKMMSGEIDVSKISIHWEEGLE